MIINENSKSELFEKSYYSHLNRLRNESNQLLENTKAKYISCGFFSNSRMMYELGCFNKGSQRIK